MLRACLHVKGLIKGVVGHDIKSSMIVHGYHIDLFLGPGSAEQIYQGPQVATDEWLHLIQCALGERMEESASKARVILA